MSEINKSEEPVAAEMPAETPLTAPDETVSDVPANTESDAALEQALAADGALPEQQPETDADAGEAQVFEAPEGSQPDVAEDRAENETEVAPLDVANNTVEEGSFWNGFFGRPNIPTVR